MLKFIPIAVSLCLAALAPANAQNLYDDTVVREVRLVFAQPDWQLQLEQNAKSELDIPATVTVDGLRLDSVGVRYKGHSSYNVPGDKKPFNITVDAYRKGQDLWGYKVFNLNNFFKDPTCVREIIAYRMASLYLFASRASFVRLYINDQYWGLYLNVQQLSSTFLREAFGEASGNHFKGDPRGELVWMGQDTAVYRANYELKTNEERNDWSDLVGFIDKLNNLPANRFQQEIAALIDVDRVLWYLAFCNILVNLDSYIGSGHNYYLYHFSVDGRFHIIPWDLNEVLGTFSQQLSIPQREQLSVFYGQANPSRPLLAKMLAVPEFRSRYIAHFRTMLREAYTQEYWQPLVQTYQDRIRDHLAADTKKLYPMDLFARNVTENVQSNLGGPVGGLIPGVLSMINNRRAYLTAQADMNTVQAVIGAPTHIPASPTDIEDVAVSVDVTGATAVHLWWSIGRTAFRRTAMTAAGGDRYTAVIPAQSAFNDVRYYIEAVSTANAFRYYPERAEKEFLVYTVRVATGQSPVVINEAMPGNTGTIKDPQGQYDDWIELFNSSGQAVDIGGMFLSDDLTARTKWKIPEGTTVPGHGYLLVWADDDTADTPGVHANFKLSKSGEGLYLFATASAGNTLIDSMSYGALEGEISYGRYPNGTGTFRVLKPTPDAVNELMTGTDGASGVLSAFELAVYPNPVNAGHLMVSIGLSGSREVLLSVFDIYGRRVRPTKSYSLTSDASSLTVDLAGLQAGSYFIRVDAGGQTRQRMFTLHR